MEYCNENIKDVYRELFDEALARYNEKQTRNDRIIGDYYEKICSGKQEKPFHEIILQIGNKDDSWQSRLQLERMKELCKEPNNLYEEQNDLKWQKQKIEKSLER